MCSAVTPGSKQGQVWHCCFIEAGALTSTSSAGSCDSPGILKAAKITDQARPDSFGKMPAALKPSFCFLLGAAVSSGKCEDTFSAFLHVAIVSNVCKHVVLSSYDTEFKTYIIFMPEIDISPVGSTSTRTF